MIHEEKCYVGTCDNCGETFEHYHEGWTMFADRSDIEEEMDNASWYTGDTDPDHEGKHYCPDCFKPHPDEDDKIIVDESRKKP
jgi:hypothetical protein